MNTEKSKITLVIVDDHPLVLDGLVSRLERSEQVEVIGQASNGQEAIQLVEKLMPDVVLMDINMPVMNGIDAAEIFKERFTAVKLLVLSMHDDREYVMNMARAGAKGYVLKSASADEMLMAIKAVHMGGVYFSPSIAEILTSKENNIHDDTLSSREQVVLKLLASGMSNKEMARELDISVRTVETHRRNIKNKLEISTTPGLVRYAIDHGLSD
ncbi:MAG: response regulator transcription factor [Arenicella sp.]